MPVSKLAPAAAVVALAATAGLAAGTAHAASQPALAKTTLSAAVAKAASRGADSIIGKLTEGKLPLAKEHVRLLVVTGAKAVVAGTAVTGKAGVVTFTVRPKVRTVYELVFKGTKDLAASHSARIVVLPAKPAPGK